MTNNESLIKALDLEPIRYKLVVDRDGPRWTSDRASQAEFAYRRFLVLLSRYPDEQIVPLGDVDVFWHQHILDTQKYADDCDAIFGRFLHHFPYFGLRSEADAEALQAAGNRTRELFIREFGDSPLGTPRDCDAHQCNPVPSCAGEPSPRLLRDISTRPRFRSAAT